MAAPRRGAPSAVVAIAYTATVCARSALGPAAPNATCTVRVGGTPSGIILFPWRAWVTPGGTTTGTTASPRGSATTGPNVCDPISTVIRPRGRVFTTASPSAQSGRAIQATSPAATAMTIATWGISSSGGTYCASHVCSPVLLGASTRPTLTVSSGCTSLCTLRIACASRPSRISDGSAESARARRAAAVTAPSSSSGWRCP